MRIVFFLFTIVLWGCIFSKKQKQNSQKEFTPIFNDVQPVLIYKTKSNYNNLVPIILSDDKTQIISYPHPTDIVLDGNMPTPTTLKKGYLLDNRGINQNVAFLKLTYSEYSKLKNPPSMTQLKELILDSNPLTELCNCGNRSAFSNIESEVNKLITDKKLRKTCKIIK